MLAGQSHVDGTEFGDPEPFWVRGASRIAHRLVRAVRRAVHRAVRKVKTLHPEALSQFLALQ